MKFLPLLYFFVSISPLFPLLTHELIKTIIHQLVLSIRGQTQTKKYYLVKNTQARAFSRC
jgi:hypothetical protein